METAGTFAAAFNSADPKHVIMVRGVCDRADATKTEIDNTGLWRNAAASNAAKFVQQFIRFGNIEPLKCNELVIKITAKPRRDSRLGRRMGFSYPFFDRLLRPMGPLLDVVLEVTAFDKKEAPLKIVRAIWSEVVGGEISDAVLTNNKAVLSIPIHRSMPDYFSLQMEVAGAAKAYRFRTSNAAESYQVLYRNGVEGKQ
jgi:hypothetical protein